MPLRAPLTREGTTSAGRWTSSEVGDTSGIEGLCWGLLTALLPVLIACERDCYFPRRCRSAGLPLVLVTSAAAVVALVSVASDSPEGRKHSLVLLGWLLKYGQVLRGRSGPLRGR